MKKKGASVENKKSESDMERYTLLITMPQNAKFDEQGRWQPTKISALEGWREITQWMRIAYIFLATALVGYNLSALSELPEKMKIGTWFGMSSTSIPTYAYIIGTFAIYLFLMYRDLIRRSISRYRLFVPMAFVVMNSWVVSSCINVP